MAKKIKIPPDVIDCACVIHGDAYDWQYVDRLYNMLNRHISPAIRFHVYTEATRPVPEHMIKHELEDWGIGGPKRGWWYKMQLFNPDHHAGPLLYFDLDTVIVRNIDWIWQQPTRYFWTVKDFKYLWRPMYTGANTSVMWWDTQRYARVWQEFCAQSLDNIILKYPGDQDYVTKSIGQAELRFLDTERIKSWRWQCLDGGYNFTRRKHLQPRSGTTITDQTAVLVFHGQPKPSDLLDSVIIEHWK